MISVIFWFVSLLEKCWEVVATVATWWPSVVTSKAAQTLSQPRRSRFAGHALWPTSIPEAQLVESSWPSPCQSESTHDRRFGRSIGWQLHQMVSWKSWRRPLQRGTFPYFSLPRSPRRQEINSDTPSHYSHWSRSCNFGQVLNVLQGFIKHAKQVMVQNLCWGFVQN